jgi:SOS-response transcriptional repressor LexA
MHEQKKLDGVSTHYGFPNPAADNHFLLLDLNQLLIKHTYSTYLMRVEGDDWQDIGIFNNDVALIDRALSPQPVDKVIWWFDGRFVISQRHRAPKQAEIWGVVTAVIHQWR